MAAALDYHTDLTQLHHSVVSIGLRVQKVTTAHQLIFLRLIIWIYFNIETTYMHFYLLRTDSFSFLLFEFIDWNNLLLHVMIIKLRYIVKLRYPMYYQITIYDILSNYNIRYIIKLRYTILLNYDIRCIIKLRYMIYCQITIYDILSNYDIRYC